MHLTASHLVVNRNPIMKIGQVVSSSKFKDFVFGKDYLKGGKFDRDYSVSNAVNYQVKK